MTNELMIPETNGANPYAIMPVLDIQLAATRRQMVIDYAAKMMKAGTDYGVIPGTGDKPTLLKPGAEKLASMFGLRPDFDPIETITDWTGENHGGEPFFFIRYRCTLYRGDLAVGQGVGSCNSWEKKYRYRNVYPNRATAEDKANGRLETRPGKGGSTYQVYVVKNPDPADVVNTIDKMSQKRALVAAVLIAVNASELFTQDIEDYSDIVDGAWEVEKPAPPKTQPVKKAPDAPPPTVSTVDNAVAAAPAAEFIGLTATLLEITEAAVKERMTALGYHKIPGQPEERVKLFHAVHDAAEVAQASATQPSMIGPGPGGAFEEN